jgi:P27 family predicted phage terminase small subunit
VPQLLDNDTLPPAVGANLEIACQAYADWRTHTARVAEQGSLVKSPNGFAVQHPSVAIANKAAAIWLRFEKQLGLNKPRKTKPSESKLTALLNTTPTRKAAQ